MATESGMFEKTISSSEALDLSRNQDLETLMARARSLRDAGHGNTITYSRKVFVPLTHLCRDVCHYCTFARTPRHIGQPFLSADEVVALCKVGANLGCQEALFTLGEKPELRYKVARKSLAEMGFQTTIEYVTHCASRVLDETGLLPHINAGNLTRAEMLGLREISPSMGIMLESGSERLCEKGMPHYGSPDKDPSLRIKTLILAGELSVPFTSGILIGIGETKKERIESLLMLREVSERFGNLQEVIVQNFRAKPNTKMASAPEPDLEELLWTIAVARIVLGPEMNIQAPPNLSPGVLERLVDAGINDWGGVSPLTPDHVNPEAPWPHLDELSAATEAAGKWLDQRLTVYPRYIQDSKRWLSDKTRAYAFQHSDSSGMAKRDAWTPGESTEIPALEHHLLTNRNQRNHSSDVLALIEKHRARKELNATEITRLFEVRGNDLSLVAGYADELRHETTGETVTYVVNRNINYTNVCYFKCKFCAFSKGSGNKDLRGKPYDISAEEIARRCIEAWDRGATEVCLQGGIHPDYTGQTYIDILSTIRKATPDMHIHAFSPLEIYQGAKTLEISLVRFLKILKSAGLNTLPGTAAEILHDDIRKEICSDKLNSAQWLQVMTAAHEVGFGTTATIMFGHLERPEHWAHHLLAIANLQKKTGGFSEFVPLPFVAAEAPMYRRGLSRKGPSFRECILMHAIPRIVFHGLIDNVQASWVKLGQAGVAACLSAGANDIGGSLMNESITRAAGADHGQEWHPAQIEKFLTDLQKKPKMRTTRYTQAPPERRRIAMQSGELATIKLDEASRTQRSKRLYASSTG